jgi:hypothetical protein
MGKTVNRLVIAGAAGCAAVLAVALPASASTGLFLASYSTVSSGDLNVFVEYACDGGGNGTLTIVAAEGVITVGTAQKSVPCDGSEDFTIVHVPATVGTWSAPGTATESAVLQDSSGTQVAEVLPTNVTVM